MALGVKTMTLETSGSYTLEELFEKIRDTEFSAGTPTCQKYGPSFIITFPALDRQNQVQIISNAVGGKKPSQKFTIQKAEELGLGKSLLNDALSMLTGSLFNLGSMVTENANRCEELVEETYNKLTEMGL
ncbi:MAG: hypothetical protein IJX14_03100 [Clostridia bacterium]|nr:hypothetical protein [Clostridia bacterium]